MMNRGIEKQIIESFVKTIHKHGMVVDGDRVLVALSGGADSVALLFLMLDLQSSFGIEVCAAHLNHLLRGKESNEDERFVKGLCRNLEVDFLLGKADIGKIAEKEKKNLEETAREERIRFLQEASKNMKATRIALGHTMNDQAENVLLRLLRGTGASGISSMKPVEGNIIRPLLWIEREKLEAYLRSRKIPFRTDSSNRDLRFTRNRIRHTLIPLLKEEYNPRIVSTLAKTAEILSQEDSFLDTLAADILLKGSDIKQFSGRRPITGGAIRVSSELVRTAPPALGRRLIRSAIRIAKGNLKKVTFSDIERVRELILAGARGKRVLLPSGIDARMIGQDIDISKASPAEQASKIILKRLKVEGRSYIDDAGVLVEAKVVKREDLKEDLKRGGKDKAFFDYDRAGDKLWIRSARKGDLFHPFHSPGKKKLSDFFIDRKIPLAKRREALVVTSQDRIMWVVGHEIDDRYKVNEKTARVLILETKRGD